MSKTQTKTINSCIDDNEDKEIDLHAKYNNIDIEYSDFIVKNIQLEHTDIEKSYYVCDLYIIIDSANKEAYKKTNIELSEAKNIISKINKYDMNIKHNNKNKELHLNKLFKNYVFEYTDVPNSNPIYKAQLNEKSINGTITNIEETEYNSFIIYVSTDDSTYEFKATYDEISKLCESLDAPTLVGKEVELTSDKRVIELSDYTLKNNNDIYLVDEFKITPLHYINSPLQIIPIVIIFALLFISISINMLLTMVAILTIIPITIAMNLIHKYRFREYYGMYDDRHRF